MKRMFQKVSKQWKKTMVIGVLGTHSGAGVTHLCISLANYISSVKGQKVVCLSMDHKNELQSLFGEGYERFEIMGVSYRSDAQSKDIAEVWNQGYDYMILDFGHNYAKCQTEFLRCDKKIIIGSLCPWKRPYYEAMIHSIETENNYKTWDYYATFGIKEDKKEFKKDFDILTRTFPYMEDSFHLKKEEYTFFQEILLFS